MAETYYFLFGTLKPFVEGFFGSIAYGALRTWVMPAEWLANARQAGVDVLPAPVTLENTISFSAALLGCALIL